MRHIMHCDLSSLLQSVQYTVHSPRELNNIYAEPSELQTTVLETGCVAQHTAICNCINCVAQHTAICNCINCVAQHTAICNCINCVAQHTALCNYIN